MTTAMLTMTTATTATHGRRYARACAVPCGAGARRRGGVIADAKKRKGFAELMGGNSAEDSAPSTSGDGKAAKTNEDRCPCGGGAIGATYASCCKKYHDGEAYPADAVTLMRTRFSAYAKGKGLYVVKTTHPDNPLMKEGSKTASGKVVSTLARDVETTCAKVKFYDLEIVRDKAGLKPDEEHFVGFKYKCRVVGQKGFNELPEERHAELSTFRKVDGEWKFLDGIQGEA